MIYLLLFLLGSAGGFLSGLLGIGGGIVLFPALIYIPPLVGLDTIGIKAATGLTMAQGFFASISAAIFYRSKGSMDAAIIRWLGIPMALMSLAGALLSHYISGTILLLVFGIMAIVTAVMMLMPGGGRKTRSDDDAPFKGVNRLIALPMGAALGLLLGMVGQGGGFIMMPLMLVALRVPFRIAAGNMLVIGIMMGSAGLLGKLSIGQVPLVYALAMLAGSLLFARAGANVAHKVKTLWLRRVLALCILLAAVRVLIDIYSRI